MSKIHARRIRLASALVVAAFAGWSFIGHGEAKDDPPAPKGGIAVTPLDPVVQGVSRCDQCHTLGNPPEHKGIVPLCRCNEVAFWTRNDKHQDAFVLLQGERAKRINKLRGSDVAPEKDQDCLGCHSMISVNPQAKITTDDKVLADGISCLACHGPWENWIDVHGSSNEKKRLAWRQLDRTYKQEKFGMTDLWDPVKRTKVCASCHIGDADPDKHRLVTHDMYAGGHPPLPAFETAVFCNSLPRHWQLMNKKAPEMQKAQYQWDPTELEQTKLVVAGGATAFRESMNLLAQKAEQAEKDKQVLDFALFDCAACHHDLHQPSWRQERGYNGPPGRPGPRSWSAAVMDLCDWQAAGMDNERDQKFAADLKNGVAALYQSFGRRPFGDVAEVKKTAKALVALMDDELIPKLNAPMKADGAHESAFSKKAARELLKRLAKSAAAPAAGATPDYDAARKTAWAFEAIYDDLRRATEDSKDAEDARLKENQAAIEAQLAKLDASLNLKLPNAGKEVTDEEYKKDPKKVAEHRRAELETFLPQVLKETAAYDPAKFQETFEELVKLLP
jgi:Cytochrome c554 and c-prime